MLWTFLGYAEQMLRICWVHLSIYWAYAKNILGIFREYAECVLVTYLHYADHIQCIERATLSIGVDDGSKREEKEIKEKKT